MKKQGKTPENQGLEKTKENQVKPMKNKGKRGKPRKTQENIGKAKENQGKPEKNNVFGLPKGIPFGLPKGTTPFGFQPLNQLFYNENKQLMFLGLPKRALLGPQTPKGQMGQKQNDNLAKLLFFNFLGRPKKR